MNKKKAQVVAKRTIVDTIRRSFDLFVFFICIVALYALSLFLYLQKDDRVEPEMFYYFQNDRDERMLPEIRNISKKIIFTDGALKDIRISSILGYTPLESFVDELMLGAQNIYADNSLIKYFDLQRVYLSEDKDTLYVELKYSDDILLDQDKKERITFFLDKNIKKYTSIKAIMVIFAKKI